MDSHQLRTRVLVLTIPWTIIIAIFWTIKFISTSLIRWIGTFSLIPISTCLIWLRISNWLFESWNWERNRPSLKMIMVMHDQLNLTLDNIDGLRLGEFDLDRTDYNRQKHCLTYFEIITSYQSDITLLRWLRYQILWVRLRYVYYIDEEHSLNYDVYPLQCCNEQ